MVSRLIADDFKTGKPKQVDPDYKAMDDEDLAAFASIDPEARKEQLRRQVHRPEEAVTASGHDLIFLERRRTPKVVSRGAKYEPKPSEGKIKRRRKATPEEEKTIRNGGWVRVNERGEKPGDSGYMKKKSGVRPQNN